MNKFPPLSKPLLDYLERTFPHHTSPFPATTSPHEIAAHAHRAAGRREVINHLYYVLEELEAQEGIPNVHEDPEAT